MSRSLLTLRDLAGTVHAPEDGGPGKIGFLLLNAGPAPRSGNSDLSVRLGDLLASLGAYAFRFDLPGLGDSEGELPERTSVFWREVQRGRNDLPALELGRALKTAFRLNGLVAGGLCAGAITSIRAADLDPSVFSGLLLLGTAVLFAHGMIGLIGQTLAWSLVFFFASAAASSAYLTVGESFPIEIRALAIALFYAFGTGVGGVAGPWLFGELIGTGDRVNIAWGYALGAGLMLGAAAIQWRWGLVAERRSLEDIAAPLSRAD